MTFMKCERCGFEAKNISRLITHWKGERQCPALHSKISHQQLIERYKPATPIDLLTCSHCQKVCKTTGGLKIHFKKCHSTNVEHLEPNTGDEASTSQQHPTQATVKRVTEVQHTRKAYPYKDVYKNNALLSFTKEIDWAPLNLDKVFLLECCVNKEKGIVDLFRALHERPNHDNIKWFLEEKSSTHKLIVYDGKKWIDANDKHFRCHLGYIYSFLEEFWCDYQMDIRCNNIMEEDALSQRTRDIVEEFFYETIVDDESVMFYCRDLIHEYLEDVKM